MADENQNDGTDGGDNQVVMSHDEWQKHMSTVRAAHAQTVGIDLTNPTAELVLDAHWKVGMDDSELHGIAERFGILQQTTDSDSDEEPEATNTGTQNRRDLHTGGDDLPDVGRLPSDSEVIRDVYDRMIDDGTTQEEARVWALDALLKQKRQVGALERIRERRADEAEVEALRLSLNSQG